MENNKNGQGWSMTHGNRMMHFSLIKRKLGGEIINSLAVGESLLLQSCWLTVFDVFYKKSQRQSLFLAKRVSTFVLRFEDSFHSMRTHRRTWASFSPSRWKAGRLGTERPKRRPQSLIPQTHQATTLDKTCIKRQKQCQHVFRKSRYGHREQWDPSEKSWIFSGFFSDFISHWNPVFYPQIMFWIFPLQWGLKASILESAKVLQCHFLW